MEVSIKTAGSNTNSNGISGGLVSQISWQNATIGLRYMFGCKDNEKITKIEVTEHGIKAQFEKA